MLLRKLLTCPFRLILFIFTRFSYGAQLSSSAQSGIFATVVDSFIGESRSFVCNTPLKTILGELQIKVRHVFFNEQMSLYTKGHKFSKHIKIYYPPTVKD